MIYLNEYPPFDIRNLVTFPNKIEITKAVIDDLFSSEQFLSTSDIDEYVSIVNYRLGMHYHRFFDNHEYKFEANYADNNLTLDLYRDGELYELHSLLDTIVGNIQKEWETQEK